jgi:hypothetical protein
MNPETNKFELLSTGVLPHLKQQLLLRPNGEPVPQHWTQFQVGECVVIKNYTFKVAYIGETVILFEPVGIPNLGER